MRAADSGIALKSLLGIVRMTGRYSSVLASVPAARLWFTPWRIPASERARAKQARWLQDAEPFHLRSRVGRVVGFTSGAGENVLLLHGWGESAATLGGFSAPLVEAGYRVVGIDLPAHGKSSGGRTNIIDCAVAIADTASEVGAVHGLVAHSMGAHAALWALRHLGLEVPRAVLLAPNVDVAYTLETFQYLFQLPPKAITGLKRYIERRFGAAVWEELRGDALARDLDMTALVFHDPDDPQVPFEGSRRLVAAWPRAELVEAPGLGHGAITRDPQTIDRTVRFLGAELSGSNPAVVPAARPASASAGASRG